jgi:hypothetical protein
MPKHILAFAILLTAACGGSQQSSQAASDPYAGSPTVYDVVTGTAPLPADELAMIAAYLRRLEADRAGVFQHDVATHPDAAMSPATLLLAWITETPDVSLIINPYLSLLSAGQGADMGPLAAMGSLFGMTAYMLEHPGSDPESTAVQVAGVEYTLHWYEQALREGEARNTYFDDLLVKRDRGELAAWFEATVHFNAEE